MRAFFCLKSYKQSHDGVVAIEFGMIAAPFVFMLVGIIEMTMMFAAGSLLQGGVADAARLVRTGNVQQAVDPVQAFEDELCDSVDVFIPCDDIIYEVIQVPDGNFSSAGDFAPQFDPDGNMLSAGFATGVQNDVVLVRASYRYRYMTPLIGELLGEGTTNATLLMATVTMQNEPYNF